MRGIDVTLYVKTQTGVDGFNRPVYSETEVTVPDVLVNSAVSTDILSTVNLTGKKQVFTLSIPKGDDHDWSEAKVSFEYNGQDVVARTFGSPQEGQDELTPTRWNRKVLCERYE